ncbi:hypothetical protein JKP88DRAFT_262274 [Tribonema minus]|uniref:Peroxin/Ferlin domain-containing protein n=1 Tax=Tribonema minus TaxID=303371 RepID=A0A835Z8S6_9STRA|nr:hypothetical protein JKP88DRAFT_262274 [Tribonema minus]
MLRPWAALVPLLLANSSQLAAACPLIVHRAAKPCVNQGRLVKLPLIRGGGPPGSFDDAPQPDFAVYRPPKPTAQEEKERAAADAVVADVEVYENQVWGADGEEGGQHVLHRWSYSDGTPATPPSEVQLPDMWLWEGDWSVDCDHTPTCDEAGWHDLDDDSSTVKELTKGENIKSVYTRRRRWVRTMRLRSGASTDSSLRGIKALKEHPRGRAAAAATALHHAAAANTSTDTTVQATGDAARAGVARPVQPADAEEGRRKRRASGIATVAVPANVTANVTAAVPQATGDAAAAAAAERKRLARRQRPLGSALAQWWEREFVFRGFGVGLVKPLFAGYMLRGNLSDMGVGLRMPITSHFNCWEARRDLPLISSSLFFFWPLKVQTSFTMSVASAQLQDWAGGVKGLWLALADSFTAEGRRRAKIWLSGSGEGGAFAKKPVQRRTTVTRVGVTVSVRLSAEYGLQVWASPYIFLLPGVRIITDALSSALALILGTRDTAAAVEARRAQEAARLASATYAVALWASLCRCWQYSTSTAEQHGQCWWRAFQGTGTRCASAAPAAEQHATVQDGSDALCMSDEQRL